MRSLERSKRAKLRGLSTNYASNPSRLQVRTLVQTFMRLRPTCLKNRLQLRTLIQTFMRLKPTCSKNKLIAPKTKTNNIILNLILNFLKINLNTILIVFYHFFLRNILENTRTTIKLPKN